VLALGVSLYYDFFVEYHEHPFPKSSDAFLITLLVSLGLSLTFRYIGRKATDIFHRKESILVVAFIWIIASAISALPFLLTKTLDRPIDAYFESVSGLTTTGASTLFPKKYNAVTGQEEKIVITDHECPIRKYEFYGNISRVWDPSIDSYRTGFDAISKPVLFWRSLIQWIGGVGIVFVFIALLPALAIGGKFLFEAESLKPSPDTIAPRVKETARYLWIIYLGLTIAQIILLMVTNPSINFFHAVITSFSTISTGGFSVHSNSIAGYGSATTDWIVMLFMVLGAINFALYFYLFRGKFARLKDPEFYFFLISIVVTCGLAVWKLWGFDTHAFRNGCFQIISSLTCTGFFNTNYEIWPYAPQAMMLICMYIGGMTGSTAGGIKSARHLILFRSFKYRTERLFRPDSVQTLRLGQKEISNDSLFNTFNFFWTIIIIATFGMMLLIFDNIDLETSISIIGCCMNNTGLAFRAVGPEGTFAILSPFAKVISMIWMLLGRLEFFAFLILLIPSFWRSK
ncbi:MAG: TrkH family potassium uptake protein, partial [Simkaniaceae bacterium]|nr:TrkH family potassium uptake protein [Simkaniaceae bacterium]